MKVKKVTKEKKDKLSENKSMVSRHNYLQVPCLAPTAEGKVGVQCLYTTPVSRGV